MGRPPKFTRDRLLEVARDTFTRNGYEATTLDEIARELGVTPAALLRHASTKKQLFYESMAARSEEIALAVDALVKATLDDDPVEVLRTFATQFTPFLEKKMTENIVLILHLRSQSAPGNPLGSIPTGETSPPARIIAALEAYFRKLKRANRLQLDPRAAALLFLGSIHSYVFLHSLLKISDPPYSVRKYIDQLLTLWTDGALLSGKKSGEKKNGR